MVLTDSKITLEVERENGAELNIRILKDINKRFNGLLNWRLIDNKGNLIDTDEAHLEVNPESAECAMKLDFSNIIDTFDKRKEVFLEIKLVDEENIISSKTVLFVDYNEFNFMKPKFASLVYSNKEKFFINLKTNVPAKGVTLSVENCEGIFSDNCFNLYPDIRKTITVNRKNLSNIASLKEFKERLIINSKFN